MKHVLKHISDNRYKYLILAGIVAIMLMNMIRVLHSNAGTRFVVYAGGYDLSILKYVTVLLFMLLIVGFVFLFVKAYKWRAEQVFLVLGILFGIIYSFLLPPFTAPDEAVHIDTTYYYASQILGQDAVDENGTVLYRSDDAMYEHHGQHVPTIQSYGAVLYNFFKLDHSQGTTTFGRGPQNVSVIAYIPQTIGVTLARLFHLGNIQMLFWGRWFALVFFLVCVYWGIKLAPIGKEVIMIAALLPITLQMAVSMSYDSTVLALCFLYTGYLLYLTFEVPRITWKHVAILAGLFVWMSPGKLVYLCLALTLLIIPAEKFANKRFKYISVVIVIACGAAIILMTRYNTVVAIGSSEGGMLTEQTTYSVGYLIHNPKRLVEVIFGTIITQGTFYLENMLSQYFGWLEITVPGYIVYGFVVLLVIAAIKKADEKYVLLPGQRLWVFIVIAGIASLACLALLFDWTPIESNYVYGVQGRYFLPMLPLLMMLCKNKQIEMKASMAKHIYAGLYVLQFLTIYHIYTVIIGR